MYDLLPDSIGRWRHLEDTARRLFERYGYSEIRTPLVEETHLFTRGIGETTDIVTKEMYTFTDRKNRSLTLRPEGTASVVRAYVEHKLHARQPFSKYYYIGPMFRYERPQTGRNRQFHQIGAEAIGSASPLVDFEIIEMSHTFFRTMGFQKLHLSLNSLGCADDRPAYAEALRTYFRDKASMLCPDCRERAQKNPLRILDCKVENCKKLAVGSPTTQQSLCDACKVHLDMLLDLLKHSGIDCVLDPHLVRGLDYYTRTVFEIQHPALGGRNAVCGGGRYDDLVEQIGGPPTPATGFSLGIEATIVAMEKENLPAPPARTPDAFICSVGEEASREAALLAARLRNAGLFAEMDYGGRSLKAQMKLANKLNARYVVILAEEELAQGAARIRNMTSGQESIVTFEDLPSQLIN